MPTALPNITKVETDYKTLNNRIMSDLNNKKEITKEEFAANEIREFCKYVMHPESDLHKDAEDWIKERLQANGVPAIDSGLHLQLVSQRSELLLKQQSDWLMKSTTLSVEAIVEFQEKFKQ